MRAGPAGGFCVLEAYRFPLTCVGFGRSRDATECHITPVALFFVLENVLTPPAAAF
jgi:hypothetical protein